MNPTIRPTQYAGMFYPDSKSELEHLLKFILKVELNKINTQLAKQKIIGAIVPHAGYIYSGYHAIHAYELFRLSEQTIDTVVVVNPNHSGKGSGIFNLSCANEWETPFGLLTQDKVFMAEMKIDCNDSAHELEHSGEVQLPFLQKFMPNPFKIVMVTMNVQNHENALLLAHKIYDATTNTNRKILVLSSSDFSHYENVESGFKKDQYLIDQILKMDASECFREVKKHQISACGYGPIMTLIEYAKLAAQNPKIELLRRGHSGEVNFAEKVVDYASFLCYAQ